MIVDPLPDIPRLYTGLAEWIGVLLYLGLLGPRFTKWKQRAIAAFALPVLVGTQLLVGTWHLSFWGLGMSISVLAMASLLWAGTQTNLLGVVYLSARAFVIAELMASLGWQIWVAADLSRLNSFLTHVPYARSIVNCSVYVGFYFAARELERRNGWSNRRGTIDPDLATATAAGAVALATFLVSNVSFMSTQTAISGRTGYEVFYIRTLVDLVGFIALYAQQATRAALHDSLLLRESETLLKAQEEQYLQTQRNVDETNRLHHDLKHYVHALRNEPSAQKRETYLAELEGTVKGHETMIITGHRVLDVVLSSKKEQCLQKHINMTTMADGKAIDFMDSLHLSAFLGNALDNAIEASLRVANKEERIIRVSIKEAHDFLVINIANHYPHPVDFDDSIPRTTKRGRHGLGTRNMVEIAESYGGTVTFGLEDDWFTVRALMPLPRTKGSPRIRIKTQPDLG